MKKIVLFFSALLITGSISAQLGIQATPVLKQRTSFKFSDEWQYLSSDIYLLNSDKFNVLINELAYELNKNKSRRARRNNSEYIEYLLVTAKVKDLKFFGGDLVYPIYNFRFKTGDGENYQSNISSSMEVIRIIDNLPLIGNKDYVEAEIIGEAITNVKNERLNKIISESLKSISKLANPSQAVMSLIGEYGKVMESKIQKTQYKFSSTIRLYEEQDFDNQLHSVNVYIFELSNTKRNKLKTDDLAEYISENKNPVISKDILKEKLDFNKYPFMVVANYKSKYISDPVIGDEIDAESIEIRIQKTKNAFETGLINKETYTQEMELVEFLKAFVELKMSINNYKLNYKNEVTKDFSKSFFIILQNFRNLKNILQNRDKKYTNNPMFKNEFRKYYEGILTNAELYLDENNYLKNIKELVNTLFKYENRTKEPTIAEKEQYLRSLYLVELPEDEQSSIEIKTINNMARKLESDIYYKEYRPLIQNFRNSKADSLGLKTIEILKTKINSSYCKYCKEEVNKAITEFDVRYQKILVKKASGQTDELIKQAKNLVFKLLIKEECIDNNLEKKYPEGTEKPAYVTLFEEELAKLKQEREQMFELTNQKHEFENMQTLNKFNLKLQVQIRELDEKYQSLCNKLETICECD